MLSESVQCHVMKLKYCTTRNNSATDKKISNMSQRTEQLFLSTPVHSPCRYFIQIPSPPSPLLATTHLNIPGTDTIISSPSAYLCQEMQKAKAHATFLPRPKAESKDFCTNEHPPTLNSGVVFPSGMGRQLMKWLLLLPHTQAPVSQWSSGLCLLFEFPVTAMSIS